MLHKFVDQLPLDWTSAYQLSLLIMDSGRNLLTPKKAADIFNKAIKHLNHQDEGRYTTVEELTQYVRELRGFAPSTRTTTPVAAVAVLPVPAVSVPDATTRQNVAHEATAPLGDSPEQAQQTMPEPQAPETIDANEPTAEEIEAEITTAQDAAFADDDNDVQTVAFDAASTETGKELQPTATYRQRIPRAK